jgi:WD40 repeat protein
MNADFNAFKEHDDMIRTIVTTSDGSRIYTSGSDGMIIEWDGSTFEKRRTILEPNNHINYVMKLSNDEQWLTVGGDAAIIHMINLETGQVLNIDGHTGPVSQIIFLPNSPYFLSLGISDKTLRINDIANTSVFKEFETRLTSLAISPSGSVLVGGNEDGDLLVWDIDNMDNTERYDDPLPDSPIHALAFDPSGRILAVGNEDGEVLMFSVKGKNLLHYYTLRGQDARINHIKFSNNGELLATASFDGSVQLWVLDNMEQMLPLAFKDHRDFVWNIEFSPDSKFLLAGTRDGVLKVWPTRPEYLADDFCEYLVRNMSRTEWQRYVGEDIPYISACTVGEMLDEDTNE